MSNISQIADNVAGYDKTSKSGDSKKTSQTKSYGQTIGKPELSDKDSKYYEELKKKYSNMNFILVSEDQKENAKANAASFANASNMVVLIDEDKIERMAEDENYRKQYEGIIANAASGLDKLSSSLSATGASVKGFGMQVNDNGTASFFAVLNKSSAAQKERIEKKAENKKEEKKAEAKKAAKKEQEERLHKTKDEGRIVQNDEDTVMVTANSIEELLQKVSDVQQLIKSDNIRTESEKQLGQKFDFTV